MNIENNQKLLANFENYLIENFKQYCIRHGVENNNRSFVTYLIDKKLLNTATIRRYTVGEEFEALKNNIASTKKEKVETIADLFNLSSRYVWSLLKYSQQFKEE